MKKKTLLVALCLGVSLGTAYAQTVQDAVNPDIVVPSWAPVENTGIAIAPFYQWNAVVHDDPGGAYFIQWLDPGTGAVLDIDKQPGANPDVSYYQNADVVSVTYEDGGGVWVDDYVLATVTPTNYNLATKTPIAPGFNPNIDLNSQGNGIVTWEDGSDIWVAAYNVVGAPSTPIGVTAGSQPDVILLDDNQNFVLTYINPAGDWETQTFDYPSIVGGSPTIVPTSGLISVPVFGAQWEWPRIQSNRNSGFGGNPDDYTAVAQDNQGGTYDVYGLFFQGLGNVMSLVHVNNGLNLCGFDFPRPVVAYDRNFVHIAWAQEYSCHPSLDGNERDVLLREYEYDGTLTTGIFEEVNLVGSNFIFSATSINTEYDAGYGITPTNYFEGIVYNDPGDLFWKGRNILNPVFRQGNQNTTVKVEKGVEEDFITVEVTTEDETITPADLEMSFTLYDQSGRVVALPQYSQEGMIFQIDASTLEHGIYLLHYTLNGETKAERIPHFKN